MGVPATPLCDSKRGVTVSTIFAMWHALSIHPAQDATTRLDGQIGR